MALCNSIALRNLHLLSPTCAALGARRGSVAAVAAYGLQAAGCVSMSGLNVSVRRPVVSRLRVSMRLACSAHSAMP